MAAKSNQKLRDGEWLTGSLSLHILWPSPTLIGTIPINAKCRWPAGEPKSLMCFDRDIEGPASQCGNQLKGTHPHSQSRSHKATRTARITTAFGRPRCKFAVFGDWNAGWQTSRPVNNSMNAITAPRFQVAGGVSWLPGQRLETRSN